MSPRKPHLDLFGDRRSAAPERPGEPGHATEALPRPGAGRAGGLPESLLSAPDTAAAAEVGPPAAGCDDPLAPFWETPLTFELNTIGHWQIGCLGLWISRRPQEWRLVIHTGHDPLDARRFTHLPARSLPPPDAEVQRFAATELSDTLRLGVRAADRRVVVRPESPFELLAGQRVDLFVGSPAWVTVHDPLHARPLTETPVLRPSDTWVGPDPTIGVLAYAGRTLALMSLDAVPRRPGRVVTRLTLVNRSGKPFALNRVVLPMPQLGLWVGADNRLFSDAVTFYIDAEGDGEVRIDDSRTSHARRVAEPREPKRSGIRHALGLLFG